MKFIIISIMCLLSFSLHSQVENVGIGTVSPDSSAVLDITAANQGVLLPRMDSTHRKNIINPKDGLILYDSTTYSFWFFRDTEWREFHWEAGDNLGSHFALEDLDMDGQRIKNLDDPTLSQDAATKFYVDYFINVLQGEILDNTTEINTNQTNISNIATALNNHTTNDNDQSPTNELQTLSISGQDLTLSGGNTVILPSNSGVFENNFGVIRNSGSTTDDFVFGSSELPQNGINTTDTLFFFDKSKPAFRFGSLDNSKNWSEDSIGTLSLAFGLNPLALGNGAISLGYLTKARGTLSMAQGSGTIANAQHAIAMGYQSQALGNSAIALGNSNIAKGNESLAIGIYTEANGTSSTAIGQNIISDAFGSLAIGRFNEGGGDPNNWIVTDPIFEVGIGLDIMNKKNAFTILKNGTISFRKYTFPNSDGNADQLLQTDGNGNLTWADTQPVVFENNSGVVRSTGANSDDFVFGAMGLPQNGMSATGTLFFFDDSKGAFRAGKLTNSDNWSTDSIGLFSASFGFNTIASGDKSFATGDRSEAIGDNSTALGTSTSAIGAYSTTFGLSTNAIGSYSTAFGLSNNALGTYSTAFGLSTDAEGNFSTSMGHNTLSNGTGSTAMGSDTEASGEYAMSTGRNTIASGNESFTSGLGSTATGFQSAAFGRDTHADAINSFVIGRYNIGGGSSTNWLISEPLFEIGIGNSINGNLNALTVYKSGNTEFTKDVTIDGELSVGLFAGSKLNVGLNTFECISSSIHSIDANFIPSNDNIFDLGSTSNRWDNIFATNGTIQTSDRRLKKNITPLSHGLQSVLAMNPVQYNWNDELDEDKQHLGLIAQELLTLIPETVNVPENEDEYLGVKYAELVPVLIKAIQEQNELIKDQKRSLTDQKATINLIENDIKELKAMVKMLVNSQENHEQGEEIKVEK